MANSKISELTSAGALTGAEEVEVIRPGTNLRTTTQDIANLGGGGGGTIASQATVNTGTNDTEIVSPVKLKNRDGDVATLSDGATVDITSDKNTLATSSSRTFTISHTGDDISIEVTLSATSATQTFPAGSLCVTEGAASGDNTCPMSGVSGDKYIIAIKKIGSVYYVVCKNFGQ